jgi:hypothetical protein
MFRINDSAAAVLVALMALGACTDSSARAGSPPSSEPNSESEPTVYSRHGSPVRVGRGLASAYVLYDRETDAPIEIGVALDEQAMEGLPRPNPHLTAMPASGHEHLDNHVYMLTLPNDGAPPFEFVELDWNPGGHEPPGIYDEPHFDFHFYLVPPSARAAIVPSDPDFNARRRCCHRKCSAHRSSPWPRRPARRRPPFR